MARKKKVLSEFELSCRERTAQHLEALKKSMHMTDEQLTVWLGLSDSSIRNYRHKRQTMRRDIAEILTEKAGCIVPYWQGETEAKTAEEYRYELVIECDKADSLAQDEYARAQEKENRQRKELFAACGFKYEDMSRTAAYDFMGIAEGAQIDREQQNRPHTITSVSNPREHYSLSDDDLAQLLKQLKTTVRFFCYQRDHFEREV